MKQANQTPLEFGLKVRQDPNSLIATSRNKMRSATAVSRPVTVSGRLLEPPQLKSSLEVLKNNEAAFMAFVLITATNKMDIEAAVAKVALSLVI